MIGALGIAPLSAFAAGATEQIAYVDDKGDPKGPEACTIIDSNTTKLEEGWYAVTNSVTINSRVTIEKGATVNLILCDGATLTLPNGLDAWDSTTLIIWGQAAGNGKIVANNPGGNTYSSAIGGSQGMGGHPNNCSSGQIIINGGTVEATSNYNGAAIGGSQEGVGRVTINGGTVRATSNGSGAAIGGGNLGFSNNMDMGSGIVTINGGNVTAIANGKIDDRGGWSTGAAIGTGETGGNAYITITGGTVRAESKLNGAAIGNARRVWYDRQTKVTIIISGGTVNATANNAPAIGSFEGGGKTGTLTINGGTVEAKGKPGIGNNVVTTLTYAEGNPVTKITANTYAGNTTTLGVPFHAFFGVNRLLPAGKTDNSLINGNPITAHVNHDFVLRPAIAPTYNKDSGAYTEGQLEHYQCSVCGERYIKEGEKYRKVEYNDLKLAYFEYALDPDGNAKVTKYNGADADIEIPMYVPDDYHDVSLRGKKIARIGDDAFMENEVIRTVYADNYIHSIEDGAFYGCPNLESATFITDIGFIGSNAFSRCAKMTKLEIRSRKEEQVNAWTGAFLSSPKLVVYGYHGKGVQKMANWVEVPFCGIDQHVVTSSWKKWNGPNERNGLYTGTAIFDCSLCDLHEEQTVGWGNFSPATCTDNGWGMYSASFRDNNGVRWDIGPITKDGKALGHLPKEDAVTRNRQAATCTEDGGYDIVTLCERCDNAVHTEHVTIPALGHEWGEWALTTPATCTEPGEETRVCAHDGNHTETRSIEAIGHSWGAWAETKAATETEEGEETRVCAHDASHTETRSIPKTDHVHHVQKYAANLASCSVKGNVEYYVCNQKTEGSVPCSRYFVADEQGTVTVSYDGAEIKVKEVNQEDTVIPMATHTWDEGVVTQEPTCAKNGVRTKTCAVCGMSITEDISKTGNHAIEDVNLPPFTVATCDHVGYHWRVRRCTVCNEEFEIRWLIQDQMLAHDWNDWVITKEATETEEGEETHVCANYENHTETRAIPKLPHVHKVTKVEAKAATCVEKGKIEHYACEKGENPCGMLFLDDAEGSISADYEGNEIHVREITYEDTVIPMVEHDWDEGTETQAATCAAEGVTTYTCGVCGATKEESIDKLPHDTEDVTEVLVSPTCEGMGVNSEMTRCKVCGEVLEGVIVEVDPLGHDWGEWTVTKEATVDEEGEETRICAHDSAHKETRAIPKLDPEEISYRNTKGAGASWTKGSNGTADFIFKRSVDDESTFEYFTGISVDGNAVDEANYTAESGSVIIKLKPEYLETLAVGKHTLTAYFADAEEGVTVGFTIKEKSNNGGNNDNNGGSSKKAKDTTSSKQTKKAPNTGDESNMAIWLLIMLICAVIVGVNIIKRRAYNKK